MSDKIQDNGKIAPERKLADPYQAIAAFFDFFNLYDSREYIQTWLEKVYEHDFWQVASPAELLSYYEELVHLIRAAHQIYLSGKQRQTAIELLADKGCDPETSLLHPALYVGWSGDHNLWNYFPRSLKMEEYNDPYLVLPDFFAIHSPDEWEEELRSLLSNGLSTDTPAEVFENHNVPNIEKKLLKLVEAMHLIDVREVEYIKGVKKRLPYTLETSYTDAFLHRLFGVSLDAKGNFAANEFFKHPPEEENYQSDKEADHEGTDKGAQDNEEIGKEGTEAAIASSPANQPSMTLSISGDCLINDHRILSRPLKIDIPLKLSVREANHSYSYR